MKTEVEARYLNCNVDCIIRQLKNHNAKFVGDWVQIRNCYDFNPIKQNSWIRLRTNGKETTLTIKEIRDKSISGTKECEIVVSDFSATNEILNKLGYKARSIQENRRIRYVLDDVEIDIDFWPLIPAYVEFEAENEQAIHNVCTKLNIDAGQLVTEDVCSIYSNYGYSLEALSNLQLEKERKEKKYNL